jgi:hypothetical protein
MQRGNAMPRAWFNGRHAPLHGALDGRHWPSHPRATAVFCPPLKLSRVHWVRPEAVVEVTS